MRLDSFPPPRDLSRAVTSFNALRRLRLLQSASPRAPLAAFATWDDTRRGLTSTGIRGEAADEILRPVLDAFKRSPDEIWHCILLFLFWLHLVQVSRGLCRFDENQKALDSQVFWSFLQALYRLDLAKRPAKLGLKILNDVQHDVRLFYKRERAFAGKMVPLADEIDDDDEEDRYQSKVLVADDRAFDLIDIRLDGKAMRLWLKGLVQCGRMSKPDYIILIGCFVYGHSLEEMAAQLGLTYEAVKKRRQRVTKLLQENARKMSPGSDHPPL